MQVEVRDVRYTYATRKGKPALNGVNLALEPGRLTALVGLSGSGKSTLVALLERLYDPTSGQARCPGRLCPVHVMEPVLAAGSPRWWRSWGVCATPPPARRACFLMCQGRCRLLLLADAAMLDVLCACALYVSLAVGRPLLLWPSAALQTSHPSSVGSGLCELAPQHSQAACSCTCEKRAKVLFHGGMMRLLDLPPLGKVLCKPAGPY